MVDHPSSIPVKMSPMAETRVGLQDFKADIYSQSGEDGILAELFRRLGIDRGFCVELGAHDGIHLSNTRHLIERSRWNGILIEPDPRRFQQLRANVRDFGGVTCVEAWVSFEGRDTLDEILARNGAPPDFDLLSIDIDGNDYHLWDSLRRFTPKVVIIEHTPTSPNDVAFVQPRDLRVSQGTSLRSIAHLAGEKGYELCAVTDTNGVFVRTELVPRLGLGDHSLETLRPDSAFTMKLFQLFDGTLKLSGNDRLVWHDLPIDERRLQIVPRVLRGYPPAQSPTTKLLRWAWTCVYLLRRPALWPDLARKLRGKLG